MWMKLFLKTKTKTKKEKWMKKIFLVSNLILSLSVYANHAIHENMQHSHQSHAQSASKNSENQKSKTQNKEQKNSSVSSNKNSNESPENALNERDKLMLKNAQMLDAMHMPMMHAKFIKSGSIEQDFLENMLPHHQGAVDSSTLVLRLSQNEKLKEIAAQIIKNQSAEISDFNVLLASNSLKTTPLNQKDYESFVKNEQDISEKMMRAMKEDTDIAADFDENYIKAMLAHHEGAIALSKQILSLSADKKVRQIASNIIKAQEKEANTFKKLLQKR